MGMSEDIDLEFRPTTYFGPQSLPCPAPGTPAPLPQNQKARCCHGCWTAFSRAMMMPVPK